MLDSQRTAPGRSGLGIAGRLALWCVWALLSCALEVHAQNAPLPELTAPVHDLANVLDADTERALEDLSRRLRAASGDVMVVVTVPTVAPYADVREYAVKLFENHGRGIGDRGKDNGLLILVSIAERRVEIEVGYGLEEWITDGFAGEVSRERMAPAFRTGNYGAGVMAGALQIAGRIAQARGVTLEGVPTPRARRRPAQLPLSAMITIFIVIMLLSRSLGGPGRRGRRFRRGVWSSGVGPFGGGWGGGGSSGGGFGGGFGGGGFGGGFGGFGGGRSGGGGGGASW